MRRLLSFFSILLALLPVPSIAADGPEAFLSALLTSDFAGDSFPRHDNVLYTDDKGPTLGDCDCSEPRENFYPMDEPVVLVTAWRITGVDMQTRTKALVTVRYRVVASIEGWADKHNRKVIPSPHEEDMVYKVWRRKGRWLWVDPPPVPRIGFWAVRDADAQETARLRESMALNSGEVLELKRRSLAFLEAELAALDALRPMVPEEPR